jgi:hypothetical protein
MMSRGQEQVQNTLEICQHVLNEVRQLAAEEGWKSDVAARLERVQGTLEGMTTKFFLKTKLSLPATAKCEQEARKLEEALRGVLAQPDGSAQQPFVAALGALEKAAKALQERANMEGMAIT